MQPSGWIQVVLGAGLTVLSIGVTFLVPQQWASVVGWSGLWSGLASFSLPRFLRSSRGVFRSVLERRCPVMPPDGTHLETSWYYNCLPHGQGGGGIICAYPTGLAGRHPELVPHEPPAAAVQDGRTPHPACPVLHPATCRKLLDGEPLSSDSSAHRAARMASDVIESSTRERRR